MLFARSNIETLLPARPNETEIAHYTRIGTLCHFIPAGSTGWSSAWATPVQFLNDRKELTHGLDVLQRAAAARFSPNGRVPTLVATLLDTLGRLETDAFQMSFSGNPDELGQWRGYAANGMGCSIVTERSSVERVADIAGWVIYDSAQQIDFADRLLQWLAPLSDNILIEQALVAGACFMKHEGFKPEREFRMVKFPDPTNVQFREVGDRLVPFIDYLDQQPNPLPIKRIIIGPGWQLSNLDSASLARHHVVRY